MLLHNVHAFLNGETAKLSSIKHSYYQETACDSVLCNILQVQVKHFREIGVLDREWPNIFRLVRPIFAVVYFESENG